MKTKKIVFINQSSGYLMVDIINAFCHSGKFDKVALITGGIKDRELLDQNIPLSHIKKYNRKTTFSRTLSWMIAAIQSLFLILFKYRGYHVFLTSNPPVISFISAFSLNSYSVLIYDLYPEGLIKGKFITEKSIINKFWSRYNKKFFIKADNVFAITEGIAKGVKKYSPNCEVNIIPVWSEAIKGKQKLPDENLFIKKYRMENKFIVMYSGNMGKGHDLEALVHLANTFRKEEDMIFIFSGEGWKKQIINNLINQLDLQNCLVLSYQDKDIFSDFLSSASIGVVSVAKDAGSVCIPSKTYNLLAYGIPLLGIAENLSDLSCLINDNHVGKCFTGDNIEEMAEYVKSIKEDRGNEYRTNALRVAKNFTSDNALKFLEYAYS